jgi:hypothetical protein
MATKPRRRIPIAGMIIGIILIGIAVSIAISWVPQSTSKSLNTTHTIDTNPVPGTIQLPPTATAVPKSSSTPSSTPTR